MIEGRSWVDLFLLLQHTDKQLNALRPRLGFLGGMNSMKNRITVAAIQRGKEGLRFLIAIQFGLKIARHGSFALRSIRRLPAPINSGALHRLKPRGFHPPALD